MKTPIELRVRQISALSLNIDELMQPIAANAPCGDEHIYSRELREKLVSLRKPESATDPLNTSYRRVADWEAIIELSRVALQEQTKDLRIACHLLEAETQLYGFQGLKSGLTLLTEFVRNCWDRCNPSIVDGDIEARSAPLANMLDDTQRGVCFPITVRQLPLLGSGENICGLLEYQRLRQSSDKESKQRLDSIVAATDPTAFAELALNIDSALEKLEGLRNLLDEKLGAHAPGLTYLRAAIQDCQRVVKEYLPAFQTVEQVSMGAVASAENEIARLEDLANSLASEADVALSNPPQSSLQTREGAYRQLSEVAAYLQRIEPHSPIPYLVKRAVALGQLPFPQLVTQLVREENILSELRREFGIRNVDEENSAS